MKKWINKILNNNSNKNFLYLFIPLLFVDYTFHTIAFGTNDFFSYVRAFLFVLIFSLIVNLIVSLIKNNKIMFIVYLLIVVFFSCYSFAELEFKRFIDTYYSFNSVSDMGVRISEYVGYFISDALPSFYLCLLGIPLFLVIYFNFHVKGEDNKPNIIACFISLLLLLITFNAGNNPISISTSYLSFNNFEYLVNKIGITHFFFRDITALTIKGEETVEIINEEIEEPVIIEEVEVDEEIKHRTIDDALWTDTVNNEDNKTIKSIDEYFINQQITDYNDKTGIFEGYNYIDYIVESLDYLAIDKDLTPTLYKMFNEGISFMGHYTPKYSCASGDTEFISLTSLVPVNYTCTINEVLDKDFYEALPFLFKNKGYNTYSFHDWNDQFYNRSEMADNWGFDLYKDYDDIDFKVVVGWQSDSQMIEKTFNEYADDEHFFVHYISGTMHWPYDAESYYGDLDVKKIKEYHPDWEIDFCRYMSKSMEFDRSLAKLLELLEEKDILDKTVISIYPDHRPHKLDENTLKVLTSDTIDRNGNNGIDLTPFIIYNSTITPEKNSIVCSTFDQLPTIANMFNLNFDPRLYIGKDIFASGSRFVFFPNGDWINEKGNYDLSANKYVGEDIGDDEIKRLSLKAHNVYNTSRTIIDNNYFSKRKMIVRP